MEVGSRGGWYGRRRRRRWRGIEAEENLRKWEGGGEFGCGGIGLDCVVRDLFQTLV
jgi:hypothetical protein